MGDDNQNNENKPNSKLGSYWIYAVIALVLIGLNIFSINNASNDPILWNRFREMVLSGDVKNIEVINEKMVYVYIKDEKLKDEKYKDAAQSNFGGNRPNYIFEIGSVESFESKLADLQKDIPDSQRLYPKYDTRVNWLPTIIGWILPIVIIVVLWIFIMRRVAGGPGGAGSQIFNIGKSKATLFDNNAKVNVTFADVAGLDEAKEEVMEVVDFLKNPKKYTALGGKIPKGVLLVGPPGTGKTLLAKAVAGEAGVPFFSISGSDFVEMFVGVGASRVRDLFKQAREKAPCII